MARPDPLRPRKQPAQACSAATVAAILEGAARILEERGLEGFNTNAVAERAGVGIGSLYQYFPGKDALVAALIQAEQATLQARVTAAVAPDAAGRAPKLRDGLRRLAQAAVAHQAGRPRLARLLDVEERRLPPTGGAVAAANILAIVGRFLAGHAAALGVADTAEAARDIFVLARGMIDAEGEREVPDPDALERRVLRAVLGYLLPPSGGGADPG